MLDPLCGRGTTLNQALMYGFDAAGMDRDRKDFEAYAAFIQTWLKRKRVKHRVGVGPVRRERKVVGRRLRVELAATREELQGRRRRSCSTSSTPTPCGRAEFLRPATVRPGRRRRAVRRAARQPYRRQGA